MRIEKSNIFDVTQNDGVEIKGKVQTTGGADAVSECFRKQEKTTQGT